MGAPANSRLEPVIIETVPQVRAEHLEPLQEILGDFSTPLMGSPGRVTNIRLSLAAINNTLVFPGEVFSFNEVVGERTPEKGYKPAPVIYGEAVADGVGGGICQPLLLYTMRCAELSWKSLSAGCTQSPPAISATAWTLQ